MSKIDIINKHLEKKILKVNQAMFKKVKQTIADEDNPFQTYQSAYGPIKLPSLSQLGPQPKINNFLGGSQPQPNSSIFNSFSSKATSLQTTNSYLDALKNIATNWKDSFKQQPLSHFTTKTEKAPPPAEASFQLSAPLFGSSFNL